MSEDFWECVGLLKLLKHLDGSVLGLFGSLIALERDGGIHGVNVAKASAGRSESAIGAGSSSSWALQPALETSTGPKVRCILQTSSSPLAG